MMMILYIQGTATSKLASRHAEAWAGIQALVSDSPQDIKVKMILHSYWYNFFNLVWYNLVKISSLVGDPHPSERQKTVLGMAEPLQW